MDYSEITQKIKMVLETPLGSVPHLPWLGSTIYEHLDEPENMAVPNITSAAYTAVATCIPEIHIKRIEVTRKEKTRLLTLTISHNDTLLEVTHAIT